MPWHKIKTQNGIMPRIEPTLLPDGYAQLAENVDLTKGAMKPFNAPSEAYTLPDALQKSIYRYYPLDNVLVCGAFGTTLANLKAVTNGTFKIAIDGTTYTVVAMDFSGITVMNDACAIIQEAIRNATSYYETVTYSSTTGKFTISSKARTISFLTAGETTSSFADIIPIMTGATSTSGSVTASSTNSTNYPWHLADNSDSTNWVAGASTVPQWWQFDFARKFTVNSFRFRTATATSASPSEFTLQGGTESGSVVGHKAWAIATNVVTVTSTAHGLSTNDIIHVSDGGVISEGTYIVTGTTTDTFTFAFTNANATGKLDYVKITFANIGDGFTNAENATETWTPQFTVTAPHSYKYYRLNVTAKNAGTACNLSEIEFSHTPVDISGSGYLNGLTGGTALITTQYATEWLYWTEQNIKVAESPIFNDQYQRIYWTGEDDGYMYVKGNFGTRRVYIERPAKVTSSSTSLLTFPGSVVGKLNVEVPVQSPVATVSLPDCTTSYEVTETGYLLKFYFAGGHVYQNVNTGDFLPYEFQITGLAGSGVPATLTAANVGDTYAQSSDGVTWATIEIVSISGAPQETRNTYLAAPFLTQTWEPCIFTVEINMNYKDAGSDRYYVMRYVNDLGEDGQISPISDMVMKKPSDKITLTLPVSSDPTITKKRIFRTGTASDTSGDGTFFLAEVDNATTTYIDWLPDADLNEKITFRYSPPDGLQGLICHSGGFLVAFKGKEIWMSDVTYPHSWNPANVAIIDSPIVGIESSGSDIYALPNKSPYLISGESPSAWSIAKLPLDQGCTSMNSLCRVRSMVVYASPDGQVGLSGAQGKLLTDTQFDKSYWSAVLPSTIRSAVWDMNCFMFSDAKGIIFDFSEDGKHQIVTTTETAVGLFSDKIADKLYYIKSDKIMEWEGSATPLLMKWQTKDFQYPAPVFFTSARIIAVNYGLITDTDVVLKIYAEGVLVHTRTVRSDRAFKLPTLRPERRWSFAIESKYKITEFAVAGSMEELTKG